MVLIRRELRTGSHGVLAAQLRTSRQVEAGALRVEVDDHGDENHSSLGASKLKHGRLLRVGHCLRLEADVITLHTAQHTTRYHGDHAACRNGIGACDGGVQPE